MNKISQFVASMGMIALPAIPAVANAQAEPTATELQNPIRLVGDVKAVKTVTEADGTERIELVDPEVIVPGDRLVFGTTYSNEGNAKVTDFVVTNPLPTAVRLAPDTDPDLTVSVDGAKTWGKIDTLFVTETNGTTRNANYADVTHVRWTVVSIDPGEDGRLEYEAIIR